MATIGEQDCDVEEFGAFERRELQRKAWRRGHIGLKLKWWLFGMPESEALHRWIHEQDSPLTHRQEERVREIVREERRR